MKNVITVFIIILFQTKTFGMMEREWLDNTPFHGVMCYYEDVTKGIVYYNKTEDTTKRYHLDNLRKWYFYKGKTIGIFKNDNSEEQYFVGDEINQKLTLFKSKEVFEKFIENNDLKPFYIRWHSDVWSFNPEKDTDFGIGTFFLAILILPFIFIGLIFLVYRWLKFDENPLKNKSEIEALVFIFTIIPILYLINYLLGEFPQSF